MADQYQQEQRREERRWMLGAMLVLALVAGVAALVLWSWWTERQVPAAAEVPPATVAAVPACSLAIGPAGDATPTAAAVTVAAGAPVVVVARCDPGVQVVDLVVTMPPPAGVVASIGMAKEGDAWIWSGEATEAALGQTLTFYGYADGRPVREPVTLTVEGEPHDRKTS